MDEKSEIVKYKNRGSNSEQPKNIHPAIKTRRSYTIKHRITELARSMGILTGIQLQWHLEVLPNGLYLASEACTV